MEETISGQKVINNFNKKAKTINAFNIYNKKIKEIYTKTSFLSGVVNPWNTLMAASAGMLMVFMAWVFSENNWNFGLINKTLVDGETDKFVAFSLVLAFSMLY